MASEWFVQQNGKQYGPLTAANLKRLAAEGKISPTTSVRLGSEGAWVPASRVQGLFTAPVKPAAAPPSVAAPPKVVPTTTPPPAPPVATPLARAPLGTLLPAAKAVPLDAGSLPAKILGALALVLGTLALATFWLPMVGPLGWLGIVVGAIGLLLGLVGFVLSAMHRGSGLYLNIAGTSSSLVGLVLTIVFAVIFEMFSGAEPPKIAAAIPAIVREPEPEAPPPVVEPEPEPEPEPVWTDASQAIDQGPIRARIASARVEQVRLENTDLSNLTRRPKPRPMLKVRLTLENTTSDRIVEAPGWLGGNDLVGQGVGQLLGGEAGKAVAAATASATLVDQIGNKYKQTPMISLFGAQLNPDVALRPGATVEKELVFDPPLEGIEFLRLELSPAGFGGEEPLRFQIPRAAIEGLAAATGG